MVSSEVVGKRCVYEETEIGVTGEIYIYKFSDKRGFYQMIHLLSHELSCNMTGRYSSCTRIEIHSVTFHSPRIIEVVDNRIIYGVIPKFLNYLNLPTYFWINHFELHFMNPLINL